MTGTPITDPVLQLLYEYWSGKKRGRLMPSRADIDPTELPGTLWPALLLVDVVSESNKPRFRYRLVGTTFVHQFGRDPTNEFLDHALPVRSGYRDYILGIYREIVAKKKPFYTENSFALDGQAVPMLTRRLSLPLSADKAAVDMVLASAAFEYDRWPTKGYLSQDTGLLEIARVILHD